MSEFIIIIIAVAISVISSVMQANKKKRAAEMAQEHPLEEVSDPWEDFVRTIRSVEEADVAAPVEAGYDETQAIMDLNRERYEETMRRRTADATSPGDEIKDSIAQELPPQQSGDFTETFNAREAVIYSEILKPKFQE